MLAEEGGQGLVGVSKRDVLAGTGAWRGAGAPLGLYSRATVPRPVNIGDFDFLSVPLSVPHPSQRPRKGRLGAYNDAVAQRFACSRRRWQPDWHTPDPRPSRMENGVGDRGGDGDDGSLSGAT